MKVLRDEQVPAPPTVESYRETAWSGLVAGVALLASAAALVVWPLAQQGWRVSWFLVPLGLSAAIVLSIARFALRSFFASRRPESWRLRWNAEGIYLRYRSYLNDGFPADTPAVVYLPRREVAWLKPRRETLDTPDEHGRWSFKRSHRWLEVGLRRLDPAPLAAALAQEAKLRSPHGWRANDFPVTVSAQSTLRVRLRNPEAVLARLRRYYPVRLGQETTSGNFPAMSRKDKEGHILALAAAGNTFAAVKAARDLYGLGLTDAKKLVDELQGR